MIFELDDAWKRMEKEGVLSGGGHEPEESQITDFGIGEAQIRLKDGSSCAINLSGEVGLWKKRLIIKVIMSLWEYPLDGNARE